MAVEYIPGETFIHKLDPRTKVILYLAVMVFTISYTDPIILTIIFLFTLSLFPIGKIPFKKISEVLKPLLLLIVLYIFFNLIGYKGAFGQDILLGYFIGYPIYLESLIYAFVAIMRFLIIVVILRIVLYVTPIKELLEAFTTWKVPPEITIALSIGFSYIPVLIDELRGTVEAQAARGLKHKSKNPLRTIINYVPILMPAIIAAYRRSQDIALAIEARGFGYNIKKRTSIHEIKYSKADYILTTILLASMIFAAITGQWGLNMGSYTITKNLMKKLIFL